MENQPKIMSTLVNAQQSETSLKVEGFCESNYSSTGAGTSCGSGYGSTGSGTVGTTEELDILI